VTTGQAMEIRAIRDELQDEGYHYPNDLLCRLSALINEDWNVEKGCWEVER